LVLGLLAHAAEKSLLITEAVASDASVAGLIRTGTLPAKFIDLPQFGAVGLRCQQLELQR
jgi:hypothetical protein